MKTFAITMIVLVVVGIASAARIGDTLKFDPENEYHPVVVGFGPTNNWLEVSPNATVFYRWGDVPPDGYGPGTSWLYVNGGDTVMYNTLDAIGQGLYLVDLNTGGTGSYDLRVVDAKNTPHSDVFSQIAFPVDQAGRKQPFVNGQLTFVGERESCEGGVGNLEIWLVHGQVKTLIGGVRNILLSGDGSGFALTSESKVIGRFAHLIGGPYLKEGKFLEALVSTSASGIGREVVRIDLP